MTEGRAQAARGDGKKLRASLLEAAASVLSEQHTLTSLTVKNIADRAGVSPGAFYLHFHSRDELVYEMAYRRLGASEHALGVALASEPDAYVRVRARGTAYLDFALKEPLLYQVLFMGSGTESTPDRYDGVDTFDKTGLAPLALDIKAAMDAGQIVHGDPVVFASVLWMMQHGFCSLLISIPTFPWPSTKALRTAFDAFTQTALTTIPTRNTPQGEIS